MPENTVAANWKSVAPYLLSLLRIISALMFIQFGTMIRRRLKR